MLTHYNNIVTGTCVGMDDNAVFIFRNRELVEYTPDLKYIRKKLTLNLRFLDGNFSILRLLTRLLRQGVISGIAGRKNLLLWSKRNIFIIERETFIILKKINLDSIFSPLQVAYISEENIDTFYFGEYFSNPKKKPIGIYQIKNQELSLIAKIGPGEIEHIHNILPDNKGNLIALAGDFGESASIWKINTTTKTTSCLKRGKQCYRVSTAMLIGEEIIYATDTTSSTNELVSLNLKTMERKSIYNLPASSIYGASYARRLYFSTNLEAALETKYTYRKWFTRRLPNCFMTSKVHIYMTDGKVLTELARFNPSILPYRLFQYPTFRIYVNCHYILISGTAIQGGDNKAMLLHK